ncbi:hypothetical protein [Burkholderia cenocepacia]|uniref:hypothetical protein n=1 Tax=Burkholderia cenocepacia TaxID=95486 RepID=UPI0022375E6A|nr:hypothetical protein [Burkholderia cenocepacia]MCW5141082.1 hypothetical protein [Burkholderia cenocepacia]
MQVHARNLDVSQHNVKKHLRHGLDISCCNPGMDIYANRRRWLAHWIETDFEGSRRRAEEATGYSRSQLSQYLSDTYQDGKSPQERAARALEKRFGKPERIMETPAPGTSMPHVDRDNPNQLSSDKSDKSERENNPFALTTDVLRKEIMQAVSSGKLTREMLVALTCMIRTQAGTSARGNQHHEKMVDLAHGRGTTRKVSEGQ